VDVPDQLSLITLNITEYINFFACLGDTQKYQNMPDSIDNFPTTPNVQLYLLILRNRIAKEIHQVYSFYHFTKLKRGNSQQGVVVWSSISQRH
jgi:hypothetical protein